MKHEGIKFHCDQCDYKASWKACIKAHSNAEHEGVFYFCDQCDYKASYKRILKTHMKVEHGGVHQGKRLNPLA